MKKIVLILYFLFHISYFVNAADNFPTGARSAGLADASVSLSDVWSSFHNQAGLAQIKKATAGIYYENRFLISELSLKSAAVAIPVKNGTFGLSYSSFGFSLYNESKAGLAYAQRFGEKVSGGVQLDYLNTRISEGYGSKTSFAAEAGIQAKITNQITIGAHIFNPTRAKLADYNNERILTIMRLGLDYKFSEKVFVSIETQKDVYQKAVFKSGVEYHPVEALYLRVGVSTNPALNCFGIGLKLKNFKMDVATSIHSVLGISPKVSMMYEF